MNTAKPVPAVLRAAAILDLVAAQPGLGLSEIARAAGIPKSSAHALCHTLCQLNLLREEAGGFHLGGHAARWAVPRDLRADFRRGLAADPLLSRHTVTLSVLEGGEVIYQACHDSAAPLGITFRVGMRLPAVFTATGKALLAAMEPSALDVFLTRPLPPPITPASIRTIPALRRDLVETTTRGWSMDLGEVREGMCCIGAAIPGTNAAVALSLTVAEARPEVTARIGEAMAKFARTLA